MNLRYSVDVVSVPILLVIMIFNLLRGKGLFGLQKLQADVSDTIQMTHVSVAIILQ